MLKEESQKHKVIIKWRAYVKMMKHVLRFGSNAKDKSQFKEVMGILMGRNVDAPGIIKDVIVEDAVPIAHGGKIEVAFKPEDYVSFSVVDAQYAEKGLFAVGWYHSHPGLTCFYSAVDIRNHLGWQSQNPSAIGIVWDHQRLADPDDFGFDVYRLDDPSKGPMSDYHEVKWILEPPDSFDFYKEGIIDLINNLMKGEPPILELNEVPDVFGDLEPPGTTALSSKMPELEFDAIMESFKGDVEALGTNFVKPLIEYLNEWIQGITQGLTNKNVVMLGNLKGLKDNISKSMADLQNWFKFAINDSLRNVDIYIDDKFEFNTERRKKMLAKLDNIKTELSGAVDRAFKLAVGKVIEDLGKKLGDAVDKMEKSGKDAEEIMNIALIQKDDMKNTAENYKKNAEAVVEAGKEALEGSVEAIKKGLEPAGEIVEELRSKLEDIKAGIKALIGMIK